MDGVVVGVGGRLVIAVPVLEAEEEVAELGGVDQEDVQNLVVLEEDRADEPQGVALGDLVELEDVKVPGVEVVLLEELLQGLDGLVLHAPHDGDRDLQALGRLRNRVVFAF